jgi:hypothetical protein
LSVSGAISEADARLIAASPETAAERDRLKDVNKDLLEACRYALRDTMRPRTDPLIMALKAAIAKATRQ